jgi:hypothetical protein
MQSEWKIPVKYVNEGKLWLETPPSLQRHCADQGTIIWFCRFIYLDDFYSIELQHANYMYCSYVRTDKNSPAKVAVELLKKQLSLFTTTLKEDEYNHQMETGTLLLIYLL